MNAAFLELKECHGHRRHNRGMGTALKVHGNVPGTFQGVKMALSAKIADFQSCRKATVKTTAAMKETEIALQLHISPICTTPIS